MISLEAQIANCIHFKWKEFLSCPQWQIYAYPPDEIAKNIILTAKKMERIRMIIGGPLVVTSGWRPELYNDLIGGAEFSAHMQGLACDFVHRDLSPDECREALLPHLEKLNIRMEKPDGRNRVHIDLKEPGEGGRYFIP